ncbi:MAG: hypothetical protein GX649_19705 [Chloroflexi bacterium]|nr:hypothetical protein [Chloroflexota bacterium]
MDQNKWRFQFAGRALAALFAALALGLSIAVPGIALSWTTALLALAIITQIVTSLPERYQQ